MSSTVPTKLFLDFDLSQKIITLMIIWCLLNSYYGNSIITKKPENNDKKWKKKKNLKRISYNHIAFDGLMKRFPIQPGNASK